MNMRLLICGVLGGFLAAYALSWPLYIVLPTFYTNDWLFGRSDTFAWFGYVLATAIVSFTGYTAARWNWSTTASAALRSGMLAGFLTAMVAYPLIGAPAAAVASQGPIFEHGARSAITDRATILLVCECVVRGSWYPYLMFWGMVAGFGLLGGLGGWWAARQQGAPWGATPPAIADEGCDTSVAVMVMAAWLLVTVIVAISSLESNCERSVQKYGFELSFSPRGITGWPIANLFVLLIISTWYTGRWCARRRNHPDPGVQRVAKLVRMLTGFLPFGLWLVLLMTWPDIVDNLVFALGLAAWILVHVFWVARSYRTAVDFSQPDAPPPPSFRDRLLLNGGLLGSIIPGITMATGVTQATALVGGIVLYLAPIFQPFQPLVGATSAGMGAAPGDIGLLSVPAVLLQGKAFEDPSSVPPTFTPHATIQDIYAFHVWTSLNLAGTWIVAATLHAGAVRWWQGYRRRKRDEAERALALPRREA